ncbi:MAG: Lrp/AsnC family transcriptional regulator [Thermodesulfobacteriota bacterium]
MQKTPAIRIDEIDRSILSALQRDGKLSNVQLAKKICLSESACLRRVRALEKSGVMDRFVLLVKQSAIGIQGTVFVRVTLEGQQQEKLQRFEDAVVAVEQVMECYLMSGDADYMLRVVYKDNEEYKKIHTRLTNLPGVQRLHSSFALRTVTKKTELPVPLTK